MRQRLLIITLLAAMALTGANAAIVALYVYASGAAAADITHVSAMSQLAAEGLLPEAQWNERLERDGRSYRLKATHDGTTAPGALGMTRDYLLPPHHDRLLASAGISVVLSLLALMLLGLAAWSAAGSRRAASTRN